MQRETWGMSIVETNLLRDRSVAGRPRRVATLQA
jgi:hypothetical protein